MILCGTAGSDSSEASARPAWISAPAAWTSSRGGWQLRSPCTPDDWQRRRSGAFERLQPSRSDRLRERLIVQLVLVGVALREVDDRPVELVVLTQVLGDGDRVAGAGVARARVQ